MWFIQQLVCKRGSDVQRSEVQKCCFLDYYMQSASIKSHTQAWGLHKAKAKNVWFIT